MFPNLNEYSYTLYEDVHAGDFVAMLNVADDQEMNKNQLEKQKPKSQIGEEKPQEPKKD